MKINASTFLKIKYTLFGIVISTLVFLLIHLYLAYKASQRTDELLERSYNAMSRIRDYPGQSNIEGRSDTIKTISFTQK